MDLENAAAELSVLPPAEFVARRGDLVKQARADGDRQLAADVKRLAKPSVTAWAVNLLATRRPGELERVVALGAEFRDAAAGGGPGALAALSTKRRTVLRAATASALELAEQTETHGTKPSPAVATDVEQTLQAVLADPGAAAAARTGRLVRALVSNGVEAVDLDGAVSGPFEAPEPGEGEPDEADGSEETGETDEPETRPAGTRDAGKRHDDAAPANPPSLSAARTAAAEARAARAAEAEATARDARATLERIEDQLGQLTGLRERARGESDSLADEIDDLEARLADLTAGLDDRRTKLSELEGRLEETDREYGRLRREREKAAKAAEVAGRAAERSSDQAPPPRRVPGAGGAEKGRSS